MNTTKLIKGLRRFWHGLFHTSPRRKTAFRGVTYVSSMEAADRHVRKSRLVVIGSKERPKWLRFLCPCGCGEVVALNLMTSHSPRWAIREDAKGTLSVSPSADSMTCGSHYWIRRSRVHWV